VKHLKLFESFDFGEYEKVDYNTWNSFGVDTTWKDTELNQIIKIMENKGFLDWYLKPFSFDVVFHKESIPKTKVGSKIEINSMEDEWFKVITTNIDLKVSVSGREPSYHSADQKYYLCDQFVGLLKLIEEVL
jgi:hypothetical protein